MNESANRPQQNDLPKLAAPAQRALAGAGIHRLDQLTQFTEREIKQLTALDRMRSMNCATR